MTGVVTSATAAVALASGAYFATGQSWLALIASVVVACTLLLRSTVSTTRLGGGMVVALLVLGALSALDRGHSAISSASLAGAYALCVAAILLLAKDPQPVLAGVVCGSSIAAAYALATRLFPDRLGVFDPIAGYRLAEPLGYWNALGIFCVTALLLAIGFVARGSFVARSLAAAAIPLLTLTLYFSFSRGAWIALGIGVLAVLAVERRASVISAALVLTPSAAIVVWLASRSDALTHRTATASAAATDGHRVALLLCGACLLAAATAALFDVARRAIPVPRGFGLAYRALLVAVVAAVAVTAIARVGGPLTMAEQARDAFTAPPPATRGDLNRRLFSLSGNGRAQIWSAAFAQFRDDPILGAGSGRYEEFWLRHRDVALKVRDAHSLYLETLAELGVVGLTLLLTALLIPVYAAIKARRHPLVPAALGAYIAYLVHAGVDWDWEMPAVTIAALFIGAAIVVAARDPNEKPKPLSPRVRAGALAVTLGLVAVAFVGLAGNMALSESARAARAGDWASSIRKAERAKSWAPWSSEPDKRIGDAELALGRPSRARASYRSAIDKEPSDWSLWFDLARASSGERRRGALTRASALNPRSPEIRQLRTELAQGPIAVVRSEASP